jgi:hypothetical protein
VKSQLDLKINKNITLSDVYQSNYVVAMETPSSGKAAGFYTEQTKGT